jgi:hypothetical protein
MADSTNLDVLHYHHAVFALMFVCEDCERVMEFASAQAEFTEPWFRELGEAGKKAGWYVPPPDVNGRVDVMSAWCSECATQRGWISRAA